jgi:ribose 5-phosphate isomerase A
MLAVVSPSKSPEQLESEKQAVAKAALRFVRNNMLLGLGSGSTSAYFLNLLGEAIRCRALKVDAVASSLHVAARARELGISVFEPRRGLRPDLTIDGADEIAPDLSLIKGAGGALVREKIIARVSRRFLVIADSSKRIERLGRRPLPVEVVPFAAPWVIDEIQELGGKPILRVHESQRERPLLTDQQNYLLDCDFSLIADPNSLAVALQAIPGIVGHGLFLGLASAALVADGNELLILRPNKTVTPLTQDDLTLD